MGLPESLMVGRLRMLTPRPNPTIFFAVLDSWIKGPFGSIVSRDFASPQMTGAEFCLQALPTRRDALPRTEISDEVAEIAEAYHHIMLDRPQGFTDAVLGFFRSHGFE